MAPYSLGSPTNLEVPALVSVAGLLVVAGATKVGYPLWSLGGMIFLYVLCLGGAITSLSRAPLFPARYLRVTRRSPLSLSIVGIIVIIVLLTGRIWEDRQDNTIGSPAQRPSF